MARNRYVPVLQEHAPVELFEFDRLLDEYGVLVIHLTGASGCGLALSFDDYLVYRKLDDGDALAAIDECAGSAELGRSFYRVEGSDFLDWFVAQSHGVRAKDALIHLTVMTTNDIIDVICFAEPKVVV